MRGPFRLPADMREGDWVELGQLGAYGACLRTGFNGFGRVELVEVADPPMLATPGYEERLNGRVRLARTRYSQLCCRGRAPRRGSSGNTFGGLTANCARIASTGWVSKASQSAPGSHPALRPWR